MSEFKLFDKPQYHDEAWYEHREAVDHVHQDGPNLGHQLRLREAIELVGHIVTLDDLEMKTLSDWGAGNGGLLSKIKVQHPQLKVWGYDLCPANVNEGILKYGLDMTLMNIVTGEPKRGEIVVLTELLEHLVDPHRMVELLLEAPPAQEIRWIVASSPAYEDPKGYYIYHLWAWTEESYRLMFERAGWIVKRHFIRADCATQFVVACHPDLQ